MFRAILFDLGDTLFDFDSIDYQSVVEQGSRDSYERLKQAGCKMPSLDRYRRGNVNAVKWAIVWSHIRRREFDVFKLMSRRAAKLGAPADDKFLQEVGWLWYRRVVDFSTIESDLVSTLQIFRNANIKLGIVSNTFIGATLLDRHLQVMGLLDYFPIRIYSSETGYRKPHPKIFERALSAIGTRPEETLFVGDVVKNDMIGAKRLGMPGALKAPLSITTKHKSANYVIRRISDLIPIVLPAPKVAATQA